MVSSLATIIFKQCSWTLTACLSFYQNYWNVFKVFCCWGIFLMLCGARFRIVLTVLTAWDSSSIVFMQRFPHFPQFRLSSVPNCFVFIGLISFAEFHFGVTFYRLCHLMNPRTSYSLFFDDLGTHWLSAKDRIKPFLDAYTKVFTSVHTTPTSTISSLTTNLTKKKKNYNGDLTRNLQ